MCIIRMFRHVMSIIYYFVFYEDKNCITLNNIFEKRVYQEKHNTMWFNKDE